MTLGNEEPAEYRAITSKLILAYVPLSPGMVHICEVSADDRWKRSIHLSGIRHVRILMR